MFVSGISNMIVVWLASRQVRVVHASGRQCNIA